MRAMNSEMEALFNSLGFDPPEVLSTDLDEVLHIAGQLRDVSESFEVAAPAMNQAVNSVTDRSHGLAVDQLSETAAGQYAEIVSASDFARFLADALQILVKLIFGAIAALIAASIALMYFRRIGIGQIRNSMLRAVVQNFDQQFSRHVDRFLRSAVEKLGLISRHRPAAVDGGSRAVSAKETRNHSGVMQVFDKRDDDSTDPALRGKGSLNFPDMDNYKGMNPPRRTSSFAWPPNKIAHEEALKKREEELKRKGNGKE